MRNFFNMLGQKIRHRSSCHSSLTCVKCDQMECASFQSRIFNAYVRTCPVSYHHFFVPKLALNSFPSILFVSFSPLSKNEPCADWQFQHKFTARTQQQSVQFHPYHVIDSYKLSFPRSPSIDCIQHQMVIVHVRTYSICDTQAAVSLRLLIGLLQYCVQYTLLLSKVLMQLCYYTTHSHKKRVFFTLDVGLKSSSQLLIIYSCIYARTFLFPPSGQYVHTKRQPKFGVFVLAVTVFVGQHGRIGHHLYLEHILCTFENMSHVGSSRHRQTDRQTRRARAPY